MSDDPIEQDPTALPPTEAAPIPAVGGQPIGPYRLLAKLGEGGMGVVYIAEQSEPVRRRVALKVIKQGMDTAKVVARFEAERQALALMDHPAIARIYDAGSTPEGRPYFAMECVPGVPINEHCDRQKLTNEERLDLFLQVCEGVQHAHQKAVIHRDLKPSNVLVSVQDGRAAVKIIDFGVAKAVSQRLTERTLYTELGAMIGTPEYMSPEQAEMTGQDVDTRTDVYSLGVILYELLVGALPFEPKELREAGFDEIRRRIRQVDPPRPSARLSTLGNRSTESAERRRTEPRALRRQLTGDLDWITMKALEKDRGRRYGSPAELAADLGRQLRHEPVLAGPPRVAYRARKFVRRHRFGVAAAVAAVLGLIGFAVLMAVQAARIAHEAEAKRRVSEFLTEMFEVSDPSEARGNTITARELLDKGAAKIRANLADDPRVQADLMMAMGTVYRNLGLYARAEPLLKQALETRRRLLGREHPETLRAASETARLYLLQGRAREAEALQRETLDLRKRVLGPEHSDTLMSMNQLAGVYIFQGRNEEAEALHREALGIRKRVLGPEHPDTLMSMGNLAMSYNQQGRYEDAEALARESLDIRKRVLGPEHPDTLWSMDYLAYAFEGQGRFKDAEALHRETLDIRMHVLGPEHPYTLMSMGNLAGVYNRQGHYEEAGALARKALDIRRRVLGPEHPDTLASFYNLGSMAALQGKRKDALRYLHDAVEHGYSDVKSLLRDSDLGSLRGDPEFEKIVATAKRNQESELRAK